MGEERSKVEDRDQVIERHRRGKQQSCFTVFTGPGASGTQGLSTLGRTQQETSKQG